jgi:hypothetical protein
MLMTRSGRLGGRLPRFCGERSVRNFSRSYSPELLRVAISHSIRFPKMRRSAHRTLQSVQAN